jgi:hypothetical protein
VINDVGRWAGIVQEPLCKMQNFAGYSQQGNSALTAGFYDILLFDVAATDLA